MAKITNFARGPRGISMKDGSTIWLDPGKSAEIDKKEIAGALPDLGKAADAVYDDSSEFAELKSQVTDLTKQVEALTGERDALAKDKAELAKGNTDLTKQVEALTKPAAK